MEVVLVDCYDSFTYNLVQAFGVAGATVHVITSDELDPLDLEKSGIDGLIIGPGPGRPESAGSIIDCVRVVQNCPILGICLGHQAIGLSEGAVLTTTKPVHGQASKIYHDQSGIFAGIPEGVRMTRYHSLALEASSLPSSLMVTARSSDGTIMAIQHRTRPVYGLQFHPESILSEPYGTQILTNFNRTLQQSAADATIIEERDMGSGWRQHSKEPALEDAYPRPTLI